MSAIDSAYHYYLSVYGNSATSRYDTHKKSELRHVYNSMLKVNKESPLYKLRPAADVPQFLIDLKEHARQVKNVVASLSDNDGGLENAFQKKVAYSSDDDVVSVAYIGSNQSAEGSQNFSVSVERLASPQVNLGNFMASDGTDFEPGEYSFDLSTTTNSYEFQYTVKPGESNRDIQEKLARLVNTSGVPLSAEVIADEHGQSALQITSKQTGLNEKEEWLFDIRPSADAGSIRTLELLGIQNITEPAENSSFYLNGNKHSSYSNTFTINNAFELTLNHPSPANTSASIGFKTSIDAVSDNLQELVDAYNGFINTGEQYASSVQGKRLLSDLEGVSFSYKNQLENIGMIVGDNGCISIDRQKLAEAIDSDDPSVTFSVLNSFKNSLFAKADNASLNPIKYVDKIIVAYKRPGGNFYSPYYSSIYSGMMFDLSC